MGRLTRGAPAALALLAGAATLASDIDHDAVRRLALEGEILPLEEILQRARGEHDGRVIEVELKHKRGRYIYEIELVDERGEVWEFKLDAASGALIKRKRDKHKSDD